MSMQFVSTSRPDTCLVLTTCNSLQQGRSGRHDSLWRSYGENFSTHGKFRVQSLSSSCLSSVGQQLVVGQSSCFSGGGRGTEWRTELKSFRLFCTLRNFSSEWLRRIPKLAFQTLERGSSLVSVAQQGNKVWPRALRRSLGEYCGGRDQLRGTTVKFGLQDTHSKSLLQSECSSLTAGAASDSLSTNSVEGVVPAVPAISDSDTVMEGATEVLCGYKDMCNGPPDVVESVPIEGVELENARGTNFSEQEMFSTDSGFRIDSHQTGNSLKESDDNIVKGPGHLGNRIVFGTLIGLGAGWAASLGGWYFTSLTATAVLLGTWEYFGLIEAKARLTREAPPSKAITQLCCLLCSAMPFMTLYLSGSIGSAAGVALAVLVGALCLQSKRPNAYQLNSLLFGIFYCGFLPAYWIKLRCCLPLSLMSGSISSPLPEFWPPVLGGPSCWTLGMTSTIISIATIIAADTGAYIGGKAFGRTKLIDISPKKTREGAAAGLVSAVLIAVALSRTLRFPHSLFSSVLLGVLVFMASLFGDLVESVLKRDAGMKDSGRLIPGHGGVLDRVDSYIFTGSIVYYFVRVGMPLIGF